MKRTDQPNDFRTHWLNMERPGRERLARRVKASYKYLQKLSLGFGMPSLPLSQRLAKALPGLDMEGFERAALSAGKRAPK